MGSNTFYDRVGRDRLKSRRAKDRDQTKVTTRYPDVGFGAFVILLSFAGFAPSLIDHSRRFAPPTTLHLVHGATALAWLLLYVTQALLVAKGKVDLHRRLGWAGPILAALLVLFGCYTTVDGASRASDLSGDVTRY